LFSDAIGLTMTPPRTVLLVHTLPRGHAHIDWMLDIPSVTYPVAPPAPAPTPEHRLQTFRVVARIDSVPYAPFLAVPLPLHRAAYLAYEGPVSNARGEVRRIAEGQILRHDFAAPAPSVEIGWMSARPAGITVRYTFAEHPGDPSRRLVTPTPVSSTGARSRIQVR
jgi:hypothetical protein